MTNNFHPLKSFYARFVSWFCLCQTFFCFFVLAKSFYKKTALITSFTLLLPTIMATPLVETSSFTDILSPSVEDQINSFFSSDTENNNNNSLETQEVINNAFKYVKYKKIKDVLLHEIKNDITDFIQNEVTQKNRFAQSGIVSNCGR